MITKAPVKVVKRPVKKVVPAPVPEEPVPTTKAGKFAAEAEQAGWEVDRIVDGNRKTAKCVRGDETVEVNWTNEVAEGPIGKHSYPGGSSTIKNAASALRIIMGAAGTSIPSPKARAIRDQGPRRPRAARTQRPLPFDPYTATDAEVIAAVRGKKVFWINSLDPDNPSSGYVPEETETRKIGNNIREINCEVKIDLSKSVDTLGERILHFCDPEVGFRALFVGALIRIGG